MVVFFIVLGVKTCAFLIAAVAGYDYIVAVSAGSVAAFFNGGFSVPLLGRIANINQCPQTGNLHCCARRPCYFCLP
jgi:hypothetical protein